jgi:hypothetical protein
MEKKKGRANPDDRPVRDAEMTPGRTKVVTLATTKNTYIGQLKLLNPPQPIPDRKKPTRPK